MLSFGAYAVDNGQYTDSPIHLTAAGNAQLAGSQEIFEPGAALFRFRIVAVAHCGRIDGRGKRNRLAEFAAVDFAVFETFDEISDESFHAWSSLDEAFSRYCGGLK